MNITITIPDAQIPRVISAFATHFGYQDMVAETVDDIITMVPNPVSRPAFAKQKIVEYIKNVVVSTELEEARKALTVNPLDAE